MVPQVAKAAERRRLCKEFLSAGFDECTSRRVAVHSGGSLGSKAPGPFMESLAIASMSSTSVQSRADMVQMACLPLLPGMVPTEEAERYRRIFSEKARALMHLLSGTCLAQASIATVDFALKDSLSGIIGCCLAGFGLQAATPAGHRFLPSFIVLSFCNGTMQILLAAESFHTLQRLHFAKLTALKLATATALASPTLMFAGLLVAWQLHNELRGSATSLAQRLPGGQADGDGSESASHFPSFQPFSGERHRLESK